MESTESAVSRLAALHVKLDRRARQGHATALHNGYSSAPSSQKRQPEINFCQPPVVIPSNPQHWSDLHSHDCDMCGIRTHLPDELERGTPGPSRRYKGGKGGIADREREKLLRSQRMGEQRRFFTRRENCSFR